jgi:hypothetical protein
MARDWYGDRRNLRTAEKSKLMLFKKGSKAGLALLVWLLTAWLFYPLITLNAVEMANAKAYLYRAAVGIALMLILFGKTIFDLLFPQSVSEGRSLLNTVFLALYSLVLAGGIIFIVSRMIVLYIRSVDVGSSF